VTVCSGCGQCCEVVSFPLTQAEVGRIPPWQIDERTRRWVTEDLKPMSRRRVRQLRPDLIDGPARVGKHPVSGEMILAMVFYSCRLYDPDARRCTDWADRPDVCRGYPDGYESVGWPNPAMNLPPRCSFNADLGRPVEAWQPVELDSSRRTR
jgi:Fe-S-cluster containining protein